MSHPSRAFWAGVLLLAIHQPAEANWWTDCWSSLQGDAARSRDYPVPYVFADRVAACAPFEGMVTNGWRRQNLMGEHHFTPDAAKLTSAGEQKVRWILTQAPVQQRTIFIERGQDPLTTARRLDTVQQMATRLVPVGELPAVQETTIVTEGHPASAVDQTNTKFQETLPPPQLPAARIGANE